MKASLLRRCVAEALGSFAIVLFGCGAMATLHARPDAHFMVNVVFGLTVAACIYALGHISAAHFNPAVSVAFAVGKRFPWREVPSYATAQVMGAVLASGLHAALLGNAARVASFGATIPSAAPFTALMVEFLLTFFLMLVIFSVATDRRVHAAIPGLAIGITVTLCGLFGGPLTGCSMNPARSLGPAILGQGAALGSFWIYVLGPVLGAATGAALYRWLAADSVADS